VGITALRIERQRPLMRLQCLLERRQPGLQKPLHAVPPAVQAAALFISASQSGVIGFGY
jgi:hypothetical protein